MLELAGSIVSRLAISGSGQDIEYGSGMFSIRRVYLCNAVVFVNFL